MGEPIPKVQGYAGERLGGGIGGHDACSAKGTFEEDPSLSLIHI